MMRPDRFSLSKTAGKTMPLESFETFKFSHDEAIGICPTGNFSLSLMVDPSVMAPVPSQPSLLFRERLGSG